MRKSELMYYYRPLPYYAGMVYKCAGHGAERLEHRAFYERYFADNVDGQFMKGVVILKGYRGDRITFKGGAWREFGMADEFFPAGAAEIDANKEMGLVEGA